MGNNICANNKCEYNNHSRCADAKECPGFEPMDCTKCLKEYSCDWQPEVCKFVPDLDMEEDKE